nr:uncharacterized protein LOC123002549 [Drosophila takahashii]
MNLFSRQFFKCTFCSKETRETWIFEILREETAATTDRPRDLLLIQQAKPAGGSSKSSGGGPTYIGTDAATAAAVANLRSKVPSISIIPLPVSTTIVARSGGGGGAGSGPLPHLVHSSARSGVVSMSTKATGTSPPLTFVSSEGAGSLGGAPALALLPRPQQQHQYQQTDKCTVLKLDVLKPQSAGSVAPSSSTSTYLQIEQQLSELEAADEEEENMASLLGSAPPAQILANQPIIVKIEPTQSFHIVDEGDTRVLSLPLSDADKLGASWIDLKDIAGLQAGGGATLLDVCFEQANEEGTIIATVQPDMQDDLEAELEGKGEPEEETEPEPPAAKRLATTRPTQSRPQQQQQQQQVKFLSDPPALARSSSFSSLSSFSSISNISSVCKTMASNASQEGNLKRSKERTPPPLAAQKPAATSTATSATSATSAGATAATSGRDNSREHSSSSNGAMTASIYWLFTYVWLQQQQQQQKQQRQHQQLRACVPLSIVNKQQQLQQQQKHVLTY